MGEQEDIILEHDCQETEKLLEGGSEKDKLNSSDLAERAEARMEDLEKSGRMDFIRKVYFTFTLMLLFTLAFVWLCVFNPAIGDW